MADSHTAQNLRSSSSGTSDHPLSPTPHPALPRRGPNPGYFDIPSPSSSNPITSTHRQHASSISSSQRSHRTSDADLLGIGPSQRTIRRSSPIPSPSSTHQGILEDPLAVPTFELPLGPSRTSSGRSKPLSAYVDSLSKEEMGVVDVRFDLMSSEEIVEYMEGYGVGLPPETPRQGDSLSPTTPRAIRYRMDGKSGVEEKGDEGESSPLFPPSPPGMHRETMDHPLRILARAVRELRESVKRLEEENERLRRETEVIHNQGRRRSSGKQVDEISIHEDLNEALSTSLTSVSPLREMNVYPTIPRPLSPTPTTRSVISNRSIPQQTVPASPTSFSSIYNPPSSSSGPSDIIPRHKTPSEKPNRSSWTSGLWVWSGKKDRPRKGSGSSVLSTDTGRGIAKSIREEGRGQVHEDTVVDEDDEDAWRKGDGGSCPSFRAIFLATRIITPDPLSILIPSSTAANSLIAYLAHSLVSTARDECITAKSPPRHRARSRAASIVSQDSTYPRSAPDQQSDTPMRGYGDQALSLGRNILSATIRSSKPAPFDPTPPRSRPSLLSRVSSNKPFATTAISPPTLGTASPGDDETPRPSVEMASMNTDDTRPPTIMLSRQNLGGFFQGYSSGGKGKLVTASRFVGAEPPLTDRYGFIYDIQHAKMLKDASKNGTPAPAFLNGHVPPAEEEGWVDRQMRKSQETSSLRSVPMEKVSPTPPIRRSIDSGDSTVSGYTISSISTGPNRGRAGSLLGLNPSTAEPVTSKDNLTVSVRGSTSLTSSSTPADPNPELPSHPGLPPLPTQTRIIPAAVSSRKTISSLLDQLSEVHDRQQAERIGVWDRYFQKRVRGKGQGQGGGEGGKVGYDEIVRGSEEWKVLNRLVRGGIPLVYRSEIWAECSGARELMVPGEYAEMVGKNTDEAGDGGVVLGEIEKDVGRTFPGNVYFGGDGPGVPKLRRVLIAYSRHNPSVGYCQGMNMLVATLLLTTTDEEQAYYLLQSLISNLLPPSYFTPDLLASRAYQLVLEDYVRQLLPKIWTKLGGLGVDLAGITFGWFLSIFTDCLGVETLFRVWDVFFVEGSDALFRVAIAILKLSEAEILAAEGVGELFGSVTGMTSRLWAADRLIQVQHELKHSMKHDDIQTKYKSHLEELKPV